MHKNLEFLKKPIDDVENKVIFLDIDRGMMIKDVLIMI